MKKILLMFVVLITSIANAQTFDFGCGPATYKTELAAIFASDTPPTELTGLVYDEANRLANTQDFAIKRNLFTVDLSEDGITVTITSNPDTFHVTGPNGTVGVEYEPFNLATGAASRYKEIFFEVMLAKWNLLYPPTFQDELDDLYASSTKPTGFVSGGLIESATSGFDTNSSSDDRRNFLLRLSSVNFPIYSVINASNEDRSVQLDNGDKIVSPSNNFLHQHDSSEMIAWALKVVQHIWDLEHPNTGPAEGTLQYELDKIFASSTAPSNDINDYPGIKNNTFNIGNVDAKKDRVAALNGDGYSTQFHQPLGSTHYFSDNQGNEFAMDEYDSDTANAGSLTRLLGDDWSRLYLAVVTAKWNFLNPNALTPFQSELNDLYASSTEPTEFVSGSVIVTEALTKGGVNYTIVETFFQKLNSENHGVLAIYNIAPVRVTLTNGQFVYSPYQNFTTENHNGGKIRDWALEVVKALWHLENPPSIESELEAIYGADAPPTELGTIINDAALAVEYSGTVGHTPRTNFMKSLAYFNVSVNFVFNYPDKPSEVELSNGNIVPNIGTNSSINNMNPAQFAVFAFEVVKRFWHIGHPTYAADQAKAQLRAERTEDVKLLGNDNVSVQVALDNVDGNVIGIEYNGSTSHFNIQPYDLSNPTGFVGLEDLEDDEYIELKKAIVIKVGDTDPANAIYGFTPSEFNAASLQEKVDKAFDIAKANYDSDGVSGSFVKGIIHGSKITLRVAADNYPLELKPEMAHDADYEGWKTLIDRILYLVKTGDGSERTTRENHINGIAGNISVKDLNGGDYDWAIAWNDDLPFIYGGADENDHTNVFDEHGNASDYDKYGNTSRVFAGYHQDNIGLLPGIIYEALLVEVHRINGYVIAADALRRQQDGGINKEREVGLKALTGDAAFGEDAAQEWFVLNSDVTVWTNSKYGPICDVPGYLWLGVMDNWSFRYMYIIIRNELLRNDDGTPKYYNNVNQNIYCL